MPNPQQLIIAGLAHANAGRMKEAEDCYRALSQASSVPTGPILLASLLPPVYKSLDDLQFWRRRLEEALRKLVEQGLSHDVTDQFAVPEFYAQYQGLNDRKLNETRAKLYRAPQNPNWSARKPRGKDTRVRVGLISKYFRNHTIGRLNLGLVQTLPREDFHVTLLNVGKFNDPIVEDFKRSCDSYVSLPSSLPLARQDITECKLDILHFTDLGMDPATYTLALSKMAPVQTATWGHPVTSGMPTIDYFLSAEGLEPDESQDQYTEKLVKLKDLAVYYQRPTLTGPTPIPQQFDLPANMNLYGCPQSLYKLHPEFDAVLAEILRSDPNGLLVLLSAPQPEWNWTLMQRFADTMPDVKDRVKFAARQDREGFLRLMSVCHVLLDPLWFGGGNTTYEALAVGTPVVTLPSQFLRCRLTYKMYQTMGMMDLVAKDPKDYARLAVQLGTDKDFRESIRQKMQAAVSSLYENPAGVKQLAEFWKSVGS